MCASELTLQLCTPAHRYLIRGAGLLKSGHLALQPRKVVSLRAGHQTDILSLEVGKTFFSRRQAPLVVRNLIGQKLLRLQRAGAIAAERALDKRVEQAVHNVNAALTVLARIGNRVNAGGWIVASLATGNRDPLLELCHHPLAYLRRHRRKIGKDFASDLLDLRTANKGLAHALYLRIDVGFHRDALRDLAQRRARVDEHPCRGFERVRHYEDEGPSRDSHHPRDDHCYPAIAPRAAEVFQQFFQQLMHGSARTCSGVRRRHRPAATPGSGSDRPC